MIITKPEVRARRFFGISQGHAAKALHVDRHTVTRYANDGLIKFRVRKARKRLNHYGGGNNQVLEINVSLKIKPYEFAVTVVTKTIIVPEYIVWSKKKKKTKITPLAISNLLL